MEEPLDKITNNVVFGNMLQSLSNAELVPQSNLANFSGAHCAFPRQA